MSELKEEWARELITQVASYYEEECPLSEVITDVVEKMYYENDDINNTLSLEEYYNKVSHNLAFEMKLIVRRISDNYPNGIL